MKRIRLERRPGSIFERPLTTVYDAVDYRFAARLDRLVAAEQIQRLDERIRRGDVRGLEAL